MSSIKIVFNKNKLDKIGRTEDYYMNSIRKYYAEHGVTESIHNVFEAYGENAAVSLYKPVMDLSKKDHQFIFLLNECVLDLGEEVDDIIDETKEWYARKGISYSELGAI